MSRLKMFSLIKEWEESGETQKEFLRDKEVSLAKFGYWRQKYLNEHQEDVFTDIIPERTTNQRVEILFPGGARVFVPFGEVGFIRTLVK